MVVLQVPVISIQYRKNVVLDWGQSVHHLGEMR